MTQCQATDDLLEKIRYGVGEHHVVLHSSDRFMSGSVHSSLKCYLPAIDGGLADKNIVLDEYYHMTCQRLECYSIRALLRMQLQ